MPDQPREKPEILTPPPSPRPRINSAKVFGVRPGSPFLFTVAATGQRPLSYAAEGLPPGLTLDAATGRISGALSAAQRGEHRVTLRAKNALGEATQAFRIVCGDTLGLTPPLGWNSWYIHEARVTDQDIRAAADAMVRTGLIDHGYTYVNIDDCWMRKLNSQDPVVGGELRDPDGRIRTNQRFPDMQALTDYIHALGLKAGIYTSPGPCTCAGYTGAWQHEEQDARTFAEWGYDFVKYDWCSYGTVDKERPDFTPAQRRAWAERPYRVLAPLLFKQPRDIFYSICQGGMDRVWEWGRQVGGNCWRTANDLGLTFEGIPAALYNTGFGQNGLEGYASPGHWNDPDCLLLGWLGDWKGGTAPTPLSPHEQYTHMSLWCLLAAPLLLGGDITRLDEFTLSLLTNDEVLEIDQDPLGRQGRCVARPGDGVAVEVWAKPLEDGSLAVGLFNREEFELAIPAKWSDLGLRGKQRVRDLWRQQDLGTFDGRFEATVPTHGVVLVRMWAASGV